MPDEIFYFRESDIPPTVAGIKPEIFAPLRLGLKNGFLVEIDYQGSFGESSKRRILPEVIFRSGETWYAAAFCHVREEPRTFRLDRIGEAALTDVGDTSHGIAEDIRNNGIPWKRIFAASPETPSEEPPKRGLWITLKLTEGENGPEVQIESSSDGKITPKTAWDFGFDLIRHAEEGDIARMEEDLAAGADIEFGSGETPVTASARNGRLEALKFLVERGADPYRKTKSGNNALLNAAWRRQTEVVRYLVDDLKFDVNSRDALGWSALYYAILHNQPEMLMYFLEHDADVNIMTRQGETCLMGAAGNEFTKDEEAASFVETLLAHGADIDLQDNRGQTALYYAIARDNRKCIELLLDAGADILHHDKKGVSPLLFSFMRFSDISWRPRNCAPDRKERRCRRQEDLARLLVSCGADVNTADQKGITPLMLAHGRTIEYLISEKAYPDACDRGGKTVAMHHVYDEEDLRLLWKCGADLTARDIDGNDLLLLAPMEYEAIKKLVLDFGLSVNTRNARGLTPLHRACDESNLAVVKFLIRHGADPDAEDADGKTPEDIVDERHSNEPDDWGMSDDCEILDYFYKIRRKRLRPMTVPRLPGTSEGG